MPVGTVAESERVREARRDTAHRCQEASLLRLLDARTARVSVGGPETAEGITHASYDSQ